MRPLREWLKSLPENERRVVGENLRGGYRGRYRGQTLISGLRHNEREATRTDRFPLDIGSSQTLSKSEKRGKVKIMKFLTTLERDEDGVWISECPSIPGCISQGDSRDEALANIREAIAACLEVRAERGLPLPIETLQVEVAV